VIIDNESLARRKFVGVFRVGDARAFADAAATAFDARVEKRDDGFHLSQ
jgi:transmembrane sensor